MSADVLIVGAGPAGLATAIAAAMRDLCVVVVDSRKPPIDKACGEGLLPEAVATLRDLGVNINSRVGFPFTGISFCDDHSSASASIPFGAAFGVRRLQLHQLLVARATALGVEFRWGARVSEFTPRAVRVDGEITPYRWLVGADGQNSVVREWARLGARRRSKFRFGFRRHYNIAPWSPLVQVHWGERCQMIVTPTGLDEVCVALLTDDPKLRVDRALEQFSSIASRLCVAQPASADAGAITSVGRPRRVTRGNVALVGDASCAIDGIAGQGLSLAMHASVQLANALVRGNLALYESAHSKMTRNALRMTRLLLLLDKSSWLRRKTIRLFADRPALFARMMSVHTGVLAPEDIRTSELMNFGWRFLWA
jgi:flavin-dependent dehydrogenase